MRVLRYGSRGPQVELVQLSLQREGALPEAPDGIFGSRTRAAVTDYQRRWGLQADGIVGEATWASLRPWLTGYRRVTVKPGDTLYLLAQKYGVSLSAAETANPEADTKNLQPGQILTIPLPFRVVPDNVRFTSTLSALCLEGLAARYPYLKSRCIGESVLGKPLGLLCFGEGGKAVFVNGAHHANEWITAPVLLRYLEQLAAAYASGGKLAGESAEGLYRRVTLHLLPLVNPDGVDLVTGELGPEDEAYASAKAMNGSLADFPLNWKANIRGVDLNLQYPAGWEEARRIKFSQGYVRPGPRDFVGPAPLAEPESRAVYDYSLANPFRLTLSYHTQGKVIYWKYNGYEPAHSEAIGQALAGASGYSLALTPPESAWAGYKDWFIQRFNLPGYTVEAGEGKAPLPLGQFGEIYRASEALITTALRLAE